MAVGGDEAKRRGVIDRPLDLAAGVAAGGVAVDQQRQPDPGSKAQHRCRRDKHLRMFQDPRFAISPTIVNSDIVASRAAVMLIGEGPMIFE
jgi:hypothetical protein